MKTNLNLRIVMVLAVLCVAGQVSFGQAVAQWGGRPGSRVGPPVQAVYGPPQSPVAENRAGPTRQDDSPFRITVVQDAETKQRDYASFVSSLGPAQNCEQDCSQKSCDVGCDVKSCGCVGDCCCNCYTVRFFGEYLGLRARDAEVTYAVDANSNQYDILGPNYPVQVGRVGVLDQDYSSGFRFGAGFCLDTCSELAISYTWFDSATNDQLERGPTITAVVPMASHPAVYDAIQSTVAAVGRHDIGFELIDLDYRRSIARNVNTNVDYVLGLRWGQLEQNFGAQYTDDPIQPNTDFNVGTDIDFNGLGLRLGLEAERRACLIHVPVMFYAKGLASLMAGEFDATYQQTGQNNSINIVDTSWKAGRIVPTFDLELGGGVVSSCGRYRGTVGYVFSSWTNVVKTEDWIRGVQTNNFKDMGDTMTFDGVVARVEARF